MYRKGCPRCGSEDHNLLDCVWPQFMMVFSIMGAALAACIMSVAGLKQ